MKALPVYTTDGIWFRDKRGRCALLRGCNLGGDSKVPSTPPGETWRPGNLETLTEVSFVGRPFPEEEADRHFERLSGWGFTFLRWCITWEAVEHAGPGIYDEEYLSYLRRMLKKAEEYGIAVFIDPHQDVWSRWTGGDGAPAWTLQAAGFDLGHLSVTGAALTHKDTGAAKPRMQWGLNYARYACATLFTLFFGGNTFAPTMMVEGEPIQDYLQGHFIEAMKHTARRIKDCAAVAGFGTLNEPHRGFIGMADLAKPGLIHAPSGVTCTPFEAMTAASGYPTKFRKFFLSPTGIVYTGRIPVNSGGVSLFREGFECPWKTAGVWAEEDGKPVLKQHDYFETFQGKKVDFAADFLKPFQKKYITEVGKKHGKYIFFVEGVPMAERASWSADPDIAGYSIADAFHWYDGKTLLLKKWLPFFTIDSVSYKLAAGKKASARSFLEQLQALSAPIRAEKIPAFLGEFGVPFDLNGGKSFSSGDYRQQEEALSLYYDAIDRLLLPSTLWNYTASNTHEQGDGWNGEDLSIYSADIDSGRGVKGFCRPYALATAGTPLAMIFDRKNRLFTFEWESCSPKQAAAPEEEEETRDQEMMTTEIYVPDVWYPEGWSVYQYDGTGVCEAAPERQRLFIRTDNRSRNRLVLGPGRRR